MTAENRLIIQKRIHLDQRLKSEYKNGRFARLFDSLPIILALQEYSPSFM